MNLETIKKLSYLEKKAFLIRLCDFYRILKIKHKVNDYLNNDSLGDTIDYFEVILDCIEKDHCLIIKNDFLHQNDDYL
jgi:hypothetical protein